MSVNNPIKNREYVRKYRKLYPEKYSYKYGGQKRFAFSRDNFTCLSCKKNINEVKLLIHHLDKNRKNNDLKNLVTLCYSCHAHIHKSWEIAKASYTKGLKWSIKYNFCSICHTTEHEHCAKGVCDKCYNNTYNRLDKRKEYKKQWYIRKMLLTSQNIRAID